MFRRTQEQDSYWSWLICFSAALSNGLSLGFALSFGVVFPVLMEHFNESRGTTGTTTLFIPITATAELQSSALMKGISQAAAISNIRDYWQVPAEHPR